MLARRSAAFGMPCPLRNRLHPARAEARSFSVTRPILSSEVMECRDQQWVGLVHTGGQGKGGYPLLSTSNLYRTGGLAASPGSCRIITVRKPEPTEMGGAQWVCCCRRILPAGGYDRTCGGDCRRRPDRNDAGGRAGPG